MDMISETKTQSVFISSANSRRYRIFKLSKRPVTLVENLRLLGLLGILFLSTLGPVQAVSTSTVDSIPIPIGEVVIRENRLHADYATNNKTLRLIDRAQIDALPVRSLPELLAYVAGVDLRQRGPFGSQADISIDGGSFEQTLVLIDGIKMLDPQTAHNMLNLPIPLDAIERVEVIRGATARTYGVNSLTGVVNIVTRQPNTSGIGAHVYAGSGFKRDTSNADALFYGRGMQVHGTIVGERTGSHTLYGSHEAGNGHRYNTAFQNNKILYKGTVPTGARSSTQADRLTLMGGFVSSDFGANGFYAAPGDKEAREIVRTSFGSISYPTSWGPNFHITPRISHRYTYDDYRYFRHDLSRARSQHHNHAWSPEINARLQTKAGDIGMGAEMRHERIRSSNIGDHHRNNFGGYLEFNTLAIPRLSLSAGTYLNYHSDYGWQWFPGVDLGYQLIENLKITAHSGTGQRIPSFTDLYLDQRPGNIGNPLVEPERAWHAEGGFKYTSKTLMAHANYFYRDISDFIDWVHPFDETPPYQPMNFDNNRVRGISTSMDWWLSGNAGIATNAASNRQAAPGQWRISLQYTWLDPSYTANARGATYRSKYSMETLRQQAVGQIFYRHGFFTGSIAARYQERISYKDYVLADIRIAYRFGKTDAYLDAQNILNRTYTEVGAVPMPGRWFSAGIRYYWAAH